MSLSGNVSSLAARIASEINTVRSEMGEGGTVELVSMNLNGGEANLAADVTLTTSNTWYDGPSLSLGAGTYLVIAVLTHWRSATTAETIFARLTNKTTHYSSTQAYHPSVAGAGSPLILVDTVTLATTTTIYAQMTSSAGAATSAIKAALTANGAGNNASKIVAVRLDGQAQVAGRYTGVNAQTGTSYTPVLTDENKLVTLTNAAAITVTLPQDSTLAFPIGGRIDFLQTGAGQVTFANGTGATVNSNPTLKLRGQYTAGTTIKVAANSWVVVGDLAVS